MSEGLGLRFDWRRWSGLTAVAEDWLATHKATRRLFPWLAGLFSLLLLLVSLGVLARGTIAYHFARGTVVAFEVLAPEDHTLDLDGELLHASQAMEEVRERVTLGRDRHNLVVLRIDGDAARAKETADRLIALLPPAFQALPPRTWPLVPREPTLFTRFGVPEATDAFEASAAQAGRRWLRAGDAGLLRVRVLEIVPDPSRMRHFRLDEATLAQGLARGLAPRPPLVREQNGRVVPSAWDDPVPSAGALFERILALQVERADGREVPLSEVSSVRWSWAPALHLESAARPWQIELGDEKLREAQRRWSAHWTREDLLVVGGVLVAAACAAVTMMGTIAFPIDLVFLALFASTTALFFRVSPLADDACVAQVWLLGAGALVWGSLRFLPWRLSLRTRSEWNLAQGALFAALFVALALGFASTAGAPGQGHPVTLEDAPRNQPLRDGERTGSRELPKRTVASQVYVVRVEEPTASEVLVSLKPELQPASPSLLTVRRNGASASLQPVPAPSRTRANGLARLGAWMALSLAAAGFSAALLGGGAGQWVSRVLVQSLATCAAGGLAIGLGHFASPSGDPASGLQYDVLVPLTVALSSVCHVWLGARARQLQGRQMDPLGALRSARRQLLRTALTFLACAVFLWPTVLLLDTFVSAAVLSTFWLACAFLLPCIVTSIARRAQDALAHRRLVRRVHRLSERLAPLKEGRHT